MSKLFTKSFLLFFLLLVMQVGSGQPWTNGQPAANVLGQPFFNTRTAGLTATSLNYPTHAVVDPATGKIFVADGLNNRVLRFPASASTTDGAAAEAVLGQTNFTSNTAGSTATTMSNPSSVAMDAAGSLWVADYLNNRVLRYDNAANIASGAPADAVLGQTNFTNNLSALSQSGFFNPYCVYTAGTTLWVTDYNNNRILRFDNAAAKPNGGNADGVLGAPNFNSVIIGTAVNRINSPAQIFVDAAGALWLADMGNNRVLRFDNAATLPNGANASGELGQVDFNSAMSGTTASNFNHPFGVTGDPGGRMYITDLFNNRLLIFNNAANIPDGSPATNVLGQPDFISNTPATNISGMYWPYFLFLDTKLYVTEEANQRVVSFVPFSSLLPIRLTNFKASLLHGSSSQVYISWAGNDEVAGDGYELQYSNDGIHFNQSIYYGMATASGAHHYSFVHGNVSAGNHFYRLKMINTDGHFSFSEIIEVSTGNITAVNLYPVPAIDHVTIQLRGTGAAVINIFDNEGRLVQTTTTSASNCSMDIRHLVAGMYTVTVLQDNASTSTKLLKQ